MSRFFRSFTFLLKLHVVGLVFLSVMRLAQYIAVRGLVGDTSHAVWPAFCKGLRFDNVIVSYVTALPAVVLLSAAAWGFVPRGLRKSLQIWYTLLYTVLLAISAANIPYFLYFSKTINSSIFDWFGYAGTTAGMVFGEASFGFYILLFLLVASCCGYVLFRLRRAADAHLSVSEMGVSLRVRALCFLCCFPVWGVVAFGIRGRMGYNPIKVSEAYYCNNKVLNQLGINPAFNLLTSVLDDGRRENKELRLMPYGTAIALARAEYGLTGELSDSSQVLLRDVHNDGGVLLRKPNVVFVLMESMSAELLEKGLTPTLDSLRGAGLYFSSFYSAGIHTNHGITSSLYSFPALMFRNLMKGTVTPVRHGLPTVLKGAGYHNLFFMTHEAQYDNMNAFFRTNGYDEVFAEEDYPRSERVNAFGVPDRYLFKRSLEELRRVAASSSPFFATLLTISNHPPYVLPKGEDFSGKDAEERIVSYADRCLGEFLQAAKHEAWYANTVFVLLGDHGKLVGSADAELPESFNHVPFYIFGAGIPSREVRSLGMQVDVMPTLLGLLGVDYRFGGFGKDLLREPRNRVFYSADNQIVGRSERGIYVYNAQLAKGFSYEIPAVGGKPRLLPAPTPHTDSLRVYAFSMMQAAQWELNRN